MALYSFLVAIVLAWAAWAIQRRCGWVGGASFRRSAVLGLVAWPVLWAVQVGVIARPVTHRPIAVQRSGFLGSDNCASCHTENYQSWHASYHRTMTQLASDAAIQAPFDDRTIEVAGRQYKLWREGDAFWVEMDDPEHSGSGRPQRTRVQIELVTGSHHYQVYWFSSGPDRSLANLPIVYLMTHDRWIPRQSAFVQPTECAATVPLTVVSGHWNMTCIYCHTTQGRMRLLVGDVLDSEVSEFGIACESCHGPGHDHLAANRNPWSRYKRRLGDQPDPSIVHPGRLDHVAASQTCGQCHSVQYDAGLDIRSQRNLEGSLYRPGTDLEETRFVVTPEKRNLPIMQQILAADPELLENTFWSDGMVRVTGREFNGLLNTACYLQGEMSCLSCHMMHQDDLDPAALRSWADDQLKPGMRTNQACLGCHQSMAADVSSHTHHSPESTGSLCYNCHMPHTTFGLLKSVRSHQIDNPDVATSVSTGRPNACNLCHLDKTLGWTSQHLQDWYGHPAAELSEAHQQLAASLLWLLEGDAGQRALAAWSMGWQPALEASGSDWQTPLLALLLDDSYDAVRFVAEQTLRQRPEFSDWQYDFVGPAADRAAAVPQAIARWQQHPRDLRSLLPNAGATDPAWLLLDAAGQPQLERARQIWSNRNQDPIILNE